MVKTLRRGKDSDCNNICAEWHVSSPSPPFLIYFIPLSFVNSLAWTVGEEREKQRNMQMHCLLHATDATSKEIIYVIQIST